MKLEKAIEMLSLTNTFKSTPDNQDLKDAITLGIEALKRVKEARKKVYFTTRSPLPGEDMKE